MTNFEKIKQMTTDELADWVISISKICFYKGRQYLRSTYRPFGDLHGCNTLEMKKWLESEVEENG